MHEIIIILVLILLNGIFSMSEIALISARKSRLEKAKKQGKNAAKIALRLAEEPDRFLSTVQIGITSIGILTGIYSGDVLAKNFATLLIKWGVSLQYADEVAQVTLVVIVTYLTLVLGELVPKRLGMAAAERIAMGVAWPMQQLSRIASPFVWILSHSTRALFKLIGSDVQDSKVTEEEIKMIVKEGAKEGEIQEVEHDIVERVFLLGDLKVKHLMTHRGDTIWMNTEMDANQVREVLHENVYEMYPVAEGSLDKLRGVVMLKDLVLHLNSSAFSLEKIIRPAVYFFENMTVYKTLEQMKHQHISQALVVNEFGVFEGIITLKDILEGLVGDMNDEQELPDIVASEGHWVAEGQYSFHDFLSYFDLEDPALNSKYDTLSGLILDKLEHIPQVNETIVWGDFVFEIQSMDGVRIDKVLISRNTVEA